MNTYGNPFSGNSRSTIACALNAKCWSVCLSDAPSQQQRNRFRNGPLFQLCTTIDTSVLLPDGRLIRSDRLARLEAVLLISRSGLSARKISQQAGLIDEKEADQLIELLNKSYDATNSAFRIERTATGYLLMTRSSLVTWLDRLHQRQSQMKLSQPSMETLTIIAYQQPITRVGVEAIRGVQSTDMIRQLIDRGLVKVGGEEDSLGRPFLYITTRAFLDMFGIGRIEELPDYDKIGRKPDPPKLAELPEQDAADEDDAEELADEELTADEDVEAEDATDPADATQQDSSNDQQAA